MNDQTIIDENSAYRSIARDLVRHSRERPIEEPLTKSELLFPGIFVASKNMSARVISRWLQEEHGVSFSPASIAKAVREKEKHFEAIAERVELLATRFAEKFDDTTPKELLGRPELESWEDIKPVLFSDNNEDMAWEWDELGKVHSTLQEVWFDLDQEIRDRSWRYFTFNSADDSDEEAS